MYKLLFLCLFLPATFLAESMPVIPTNNDIPRFQMIADGLYRGGQPDKKGFEYLKKHGVKTIINLRDENNDEESWVESLGMNYVRIPMSVKPWSKIDAKDIAKYMEIVNDPSNYPIFFHCRRGADRTGAMAGFYRIAVQGWDGRKAYDEARAIGMRWWYAGLKDQLYDFKGTGREIGAPKWTVSDF